MKFNKLLVVGIFLLAIFTLGVVSAAENITSDQLAADANIEELSSSSDVELKSSADFSDNLIGEDEYGNSSKLPSDISINVSDVYEGNDAQISVYGPYDATGNVSVYLNGYERYYALENGYCMATFSNLSAGNYTVFARYLGDVNYLPSEAYSSFCVMPYNNFQSCNVDLMVWSYTNVSMANVGDVISNKISVQNNGPSTATNVIVNAMLPASFVFREYETKYGNYDYQTGIWTIGELYPNDYVILYITGYAVSAGNHTVFAQVSSSENDINKSNNYAGESFVICGAVDLDVVITSNVTSANGGDLIECTVAIRNNGSGFANAVNAHVSIPDHLEYLSHELTSGYFDGSSWTIGNLASGDVAYLNIICKAFVQGNPTLTAQAYSNDSDMNYTNNYAEQSFEIFSSPDLGVMVSCYSGSVTVGDMVSFTLSVMNNGPQNANNVHVEIIAPVNLKYEDYKSDVGSFDGYYWNIGDLNSSEMVYLDVIYQALKEGNSTLTANVDSSGSDSDLTNNYDDSSIVVLPKSLQVPYLYVYVTDVYEGELAIITVNVPDDATGTITLSVDGRNYTDFVVNGQSIFNISGLMNGIYDVVSIYSGDSNYDVAQNIVSLTVMPNQNVSSKMNVNLTISVDDIYEGEGAIVGVILPSFDVTGNVSISIDGDESVYCVLGNGSCGAYFSNLGPGMHSVYAKYWGNEYYLPSEASSSFYVIPKGNVSSKKDVNLTVIVDDIIEGENATITVLMSVDASVEVYVDGKSYTLYMDKGIAVLGVPDLTAGEYVVQVLFNGNDEYYSVNASARFNVVKREDNQTSGNSTGNMGHEDMPHLNTAYSGVVSGDVDLATANPWNTSGQLTYDVPAEAKEIKSADLYVYVYSGSAQNTYGANANVSINTAAGEQQIASEQLWIEDGSADGTIYTVNGHINKCYTDYQMYYDLTDTFKGLNGSSISIKVDTFKMENKQFDGRIKLIALVLAYDDGDNDTINYWVDSTQKWTKTNVTTTFATETAHDIIKADLINVALSSADGSYKLNGEFLGGADNHTSGKYYQYNYWAVTDKINGRYSTELLSLNDGNSSYSSIKNVLTLLKIRSKTLTADVSLATEFTSIPCIYAGTNNTFTVDVEADKAANYTIKLVADGMVVDSIVVALDSEYKTTVLLTDPTIRPIDETTVNGANNTRVNYTVNVIYLGSIVGSASINVPVLYNGNLGYDMEYDLAGFDFADNFLITGDVVIDIQDYSTYLAASTMMNRTDVWTVNLTDDCEIVKGFLLIPYNWFNAKKYHEDVGMFDVSFNGVSIKPAAFYRDQGNLGNYGQYGYGLLVYSVGNLINTNGNNTLELNKVYSGTPAVYPSALVYMYNDSSNNFKEVSLVLGADLLSNVYNKAGRIVKSDSQIYVNELDVSDATIYVLASGAQAGEGNIIFNGKQFTDVWNGTSSTTNLFSAEVTGSLANYNNISLVATGATILELGQMIVTTLTPANNTLLDANLNVVAEDIMYGENATIVVSLDDEATGSVIIEVNKVTYNVTVIGGMAVLTVPDLDAGNCIVVVKYLGDANYAESSWVSTSFHVLKPEIIIEAQTVWIGSDSVITVTSSNLTGTVYINIENSTFLNQPLVDGVATFFIGADDLFEGSNDFVVTLNDKQYDANLQVLGGEISPDTFKYYFDENNGNRLFDYVPEGATLDFRGLFIGNKYNVYINKPVNVISNWGAEFKYTEDLGTTLNKENCIKFNVVAGGDHTNITGIRIINGDLFIENVSYVTVDDIYMKNDVSGVGADTGFLAIHTGAYYTTVKNSYFENGGTGSSCVLLGKGGKYATFDNNTFEITGSSGNVLSSNIYVGEGDRPQYVNYTNNVINSHMEKASSLMYGITVCGEGNIIENNSLLNFKGNGIVNQYGATSTNNIYRNNVITGGASMQTGTYSLVENNDVSEGSITVATGCIFINNLANSLTISGTNVYACNSTVLKTVSITGGNMTFTDNVVNGRVTVRAGDNLISNNVIKTEAEYAIDLTSSKNNVVQNNMLYAQYYTGDCAVYFTDESNLVNGNYPLDANLNVVAEDSVHGGNATIFVSLNENATGEVLIYVNGSVFNAFIVDGMYVLTIPNLDVGNYAVNVSYAGDSIYAASEANTSFNVFAKNDVNLTVGSLTLIEGENATIAISMACDGAVDVYINNVIYTVFVCNGVGQLSISNLKMGTYEILAVFNGDENFEASSASANLTVLNKDLPIVDLQVSVDINSTSYYAGDIASIIVRALNNGPSDANGVYVDIMLPNSFNLISSDCPIGYFDNHCWNISKLASGEMCYLNIICQAAAVGNSTLTAQVNAYENDSDLSNNYGSICISILSNSIVTPELFIDVVGIYEGEDAIITVNVPADATGTIMLTLNNVNYNQSVVNGQCVFSVGGLNAGVYEVIAQYSGDNLYLPAQNTAGFTVMSNQNGTSSKKDVSLTVFADNILEGDNATINVVMSVDDVVSVYAAGTLYSLTINNGSASLGISGLTAGEYEVMVLFNGNDEYYSANASVRFNVIKKEDNQTSGNSTNIGISFVMADNVTVIYGEPIFVPVTSVNAISIIYEIVDEFENIVEKGSISEEYILVGNLSVGEYIVMWTTVVDDYHSAATAVSYISVLSNGNVSSKQEANLTVIAMDIFEGENSTIAVHMSVDGEVLIYLNGKAYTVNVVDGSASWTISGLSEGNYTVSALFMGDENTLPANVTETFAVIKQDNEPVTIEFEVQDIVYGDNEVIEINYSKAIDDTLIVNVNGANFIASIVNGTGSLTIPGLDAGEYVVIINGDNKTFVVSKASAFMILEANPIYYGDNAIISVRLPDDATGNVTLTISDRSYQESATALVIFNIDGLAIGDYQVEVNYWGDNKYSRISNATSLRVSEVGNASFKKEVTLAIEVSNIFEGENSTITIHMSVDGEVLIYLNGKAYTVNVVDGSASWTISGLSEGNYTVSALFMGDENTLPANVTETFAVIKQDNEPVTIEFEVQNIVYGDTEVIEITYSKAIDEVLDVTVDGVLYKAPILSGKGSLSIPNLGAGEYAVVIGDANKTFKVSKATIEMTLEVDSIVYGDETITLLLTEDLDGIVTIQVDGKNYTADIKNKKATFNVSGLDADNYELIAIYKGNNNYYEKTTTFTLTVEKLRVNVNLTVDNFTYSNTETLEFNVDGNITGQIRLDIGDKFYYSYVDNRKVTFNVTGLEVGNYKAVIVYAGNNNTYISNTIYNVTIKQADIDADIHIGTLSYSKDNTIEVNAPEGLTGNITIIIGNRHYTKVIDNRTIIFHIENLDAGNYEVTTIYEGNNNYYSKTVIYNITVEKMNVTFDMDVKEISYNETNKLTFNAPEGVTGTVYIRIGDDTYETIVLNGVVEVYVKNINAGNHVVRAIYAGNNNYYESETVFNITIKQLDVPITLKQDKITYNKHNSLTINIPEGVTGNMSIRIGNETYTTIIDNGTAVFNILNINAGNYLVEAIYAGNDNYYENHTFFNITIEQMTVAIELGVGSVSYNRNETIDLIFPEDASGNVSIEIGNKTFNTIVNNGKATFNIVNVNAGNYVATAIYEGNNNYAKSNATFNIYIEKVDVNMKLVTPSISYNKNEAIVINVSDDASGNLSLKIGDKTFNSVINNYGEATFNIVGVNAGNYVATIRYDGDVNYNEADMMVNITIEKIDVEMELSAPSISYSKNEVIDIYVPVDASGNVTLTVSNTIVTSIIHEGKATFSNLNLPAGNYIVSAKYPGDVNYNVFEKIFNLTISKITSAIRIASNDVTYGEIPQIEITVSKDATGEVIIYVGNNNYTANIEDGIADVNLTGLNAGDYDVIVTYPGDVNFETAQNETKLTINKKDSALTIETNDINVGEAANVVVNVDADASGSIRLNINGVIYTVDIVDGEAVFNVSGLSAGDYSVVAVYAGDVNYNNNSATSRFTVNKLNSTVNIKVSDSYVGDVANVVVNVNSDASGSISLNVNNVAYSADIVDGEAVFNVSGLSAGDYTVVAVYAGDMKYLGNSATSRFTVKKVASTLTVNAGNAKVGEEVNVVVSLSSDATGVVKITADKSYTVDIVNGTAKLTIPTMASGNYTIKASYDGDAKYLSNNASCDITIRLCEIEIIIDADEITVGETAHIVFTFPEDATGQLSTSVYGSIRSEGVSGGIFEYDITPSTAGNFTITADFLGDDKYAAKSFNGVLIVKPVKPSIAVDLAQIRVGETTTLTVTLPSDAYGYVFVNLPGSTKSAYINNGVATFDLEAYADPGNYSVSIRYAGNDKYMEVETTTSFIIKAKLVKANAVISAEDIYVGDSQTVTIALPNDATGTVSLKVNGNTYTKTLIDGQATFAIPDLAVGNYEISLTYSGDDKYNSTTQTNEFKVLKLLDPELKVAVSDIIISQNAVITVTVNEEVSGSVTIIVDGTSYNAYIINGKVTLTISGLSAGTHSVSAVFNGEGIFDASQKDVSFNVIRYNIRLVASPVTMTYTDGSSFKVRVFGENGAAVGAGKSVTIKIGSTSRVVKTDAKGYATVKLTQIPGTYNIISTYNGVSLSNKLTVKHLVTLKTATLKKSAKKLTLQATLGKVNGKYLKNKKITFKINGKRVATAKTNAKGVAKITINNPSVVKNLKVGKKVTYQATYLKDTVKKTTKIKK